jgi:pyruvate dehydrogenase E1 component alpha subunit
MENPLLPHRKLKELYKLMLRCRELSDKTLAREALLAATTIHLQPGDLLCPEPGDDLATLAPAAKSKKLPASTLIPPAGLARLAAAAAAARGLQAAPPAPPAESEDPAEPALVLAYARTSIAEPAWQPALTWAHTAALPLILTIADTGTNARTSATQPALTWPNLSGFAKRLRLPILSVDGEDAVAVFRCMQESAIRARSGSGPAIIWAVMSPKPQPRSRQPLARLQKYLADRKIPLPH